MRKIQWIVFCAAFGLLVCLVVSDRANRADAAKQDCTKGCGLMVDDVWTGGMAILFVYSEDQRGEALVIGAVRVGRDNSQEIVPLNSEWNQRFKTALQVDKLSRGKQPRLWRDRLASRDARRIA